MPAGSAVTVMAVGPGGQVLEIAVEGNSITLYGWPGSVVRLFQGETELGKGRWERPPAP
jgi:hypothetical protein